MENTYYKLVKKDAVMYGDEILYRIKALGSFDNIKKGELGEYISERTLLEDYGWVGENSMMRGAAVITHHATVTNSIVEEAIISFSDIDRSFVSGYVTIEDSKLRGCHVTTDVGNRVTNINATNCIINNADVGYSDDFDDPININRVRVSGTHERRVKLSEDELKELHQKLQSYGIEERS